MTQNTLDELLMELFTCGQQFGLTRGRHEVLKNAQRAKEINDVLRKELVKPVKTAPAIPTSVAEEALLSLPAQLTLMRCNAPRPDHDDLYARGYAEAQHEALRLVTKTISQIDKTRQGSPG